MTLTIAVDLDGVVADFDAGWRHVYGQWFAKRTRPQRGDSIAPSPELPPPSVQWDDVLTNTQFDTMAEFWAWVDDVPYFWQTMPLIPGALGSIRRLRKAGHRLMFVTARHDKAYKGTTEWLLYHGLGSHSLHMTGEKFKLQEPQVFIDDSPHQLEQLTSNGRPAIRFDQPWNSGCPGIRANDWTEVERIIGTMASD